MEDLVNFEVLERRLSFRSLVESRPDVFIYAGKEFFIKDYCHICNSDGSFVCIFCKTKLVYLRKSCDYLFMVGDVYSDKIIACLLSSDYYKVFEQFYTNVKNLL